MKLASFRWAADKHLRDAVRDVAADSRHANPQLYARAIARGHRHPHAVRILARAWLGVIWRCWQDHQPYDPARRRALQAVVQELHTSADGGQCAGDGGLTGR